MSEQPPSNENKHERALRLIEMNQLIRMGLDDADVEGRFIDVHTAAMIATKYQRGPDTAVYRFAATGEVDTLGMHEELIGSYWSTQTNYGKREITHLGLYIASHPNQDAIEGFENPYLD